MCRSVVRWSSSRWDTHVEVCLMNSRGGRTLCAVLIFGQKMAPHVRTHFLFVAAAECVVQSAIFIGVIIYMIQGHFGGGRVVWAVVNGG